MPSYLSDAQKAQFETIMSNFHDTFARDVTLFKIGQKIGLSTNPNFNSLYGRNSSNTTFVEQSLTVKARVRYFKQEEEIFLNRDGNASTGGQAKILMPAGSVKIRVDSTAHEFLGETKRVEFDGKRFQVLHNPRPVGTFGPQHYDWFLAPLP